jgi:hypothetical protein
MREGGFLVFFATLLTGPAVFACGDKLMLLTAGARFRQVNSVLHPASILAYTSQNSPISGVVRELERQPALHRAGHKFVAVQDFTRLDEALKNGKYDLVLIEPSDADRLLQGIRSAPSKPLILPVLYKPTRAEATAVEKRFHCLLKAPGSLSHYLSAIDEAMEIRLKRQPGRTLRR